MGRKHVFIATVFMLFVAATTSLALTADKYQWKLEDTEDDCQIYTSPVAGKPYIAAKTTCMIPARMEVVAVVLSDIPNFPEWMHDCKETKVLKVVDEEKDLFIFWLRQHIPLLTDRDVVLKSSRTYNPETGSSTIISSSTNEMSYDSGEGYVRMPSLLNELTLEWIPGDREHTKVTFMTDPDLGKGLPKGITNNQIKKLPLNTLKGMMKMVKLQKYIDSAKTSKYHQLIEESIKAGDLK
jgi:START domain.